MTIHEPPREELGEKQPSTPTINQTQTETGSPPVYGVMPNTSYPYYNQSYYPPKPAGNPNPVVQVIFWLGYALVGFWVDLSLAITVWVLGIILPFALPLTILARSVWGPGWWTGAGYDGRYDWPWFGQSDALAYTWAGIISLIGIAILIFAILTAKPLGRLHLALFRDLGGLNI